jgi:branched-chain amino acid transport system permease protein
MIVAGYSFEQYVAQILAGLGSGSVLFLVASGLTLIFGALRVMNFAHGGLFMIGAFLTYTIETHLGFGNGMFVVVVLLAAIGVALGGLVLEVGFFRPIYGRALLTQLIVTFAFAFIISGLMRYVWGAGGTTTNAPPFLSGHLQLGTSSVTYFKFFAMGLAVAVAVGLWAILYRTGLGRMIRAAVSDPELLRLSGVNVRLLFTGVFTMAAFFAGLAGAIQSFEGAIDWTIGDDAIIRAFIVVVIGGLGSISGAFIAAMLVGVAEALGTFWVPPASIAIVFAVLVVVLALRPQGLRGATA